MDPGTIEHGLFFAFGGMTVLASLVVIWAKNPIHSAMALVGAFFNLAAIYILLWAHTIAVLQVLVYAGAIMVLFLFVIMLLSLTDADLQGGRLTLSRIAGGAATLVLLVLIVMVLRKTTLTNAPLPDGASFGSLKQMGELVYTQYLLPFEAVSLLLLVAILGSVVVAKTRI